MIVQVQQNKNQFISAGKFDIFRPEQGDTETEIKEWTKSGLTRQTGLYLFTKQTLPLSAI